MIYVLITFFVLLLLNLYSAELSHEAFRQSKQTAMSEKCQLAADEISKLEIINTTTITNTLMQMDSLKVTRTIVTNQSGKALYDSAAVSLNTYVLLPEVIRAMDGMDVVTWQYQEGVIQTHAASPIVYYDSVVGCVYMMETDSVQGALIQSLQTNILQITLVLELIVILFSIAFSRTFSKRLNKVMTSMRIIQNGDYTHKLEMGGNDELTILGNEFNDLTERLNTSEQKRRRFVSDASHELKTPLASIKLLTDSILQNDMDAETIREFVGDIGDEAERLNRMTAKLLSLTKVDGDPVVDSEIIYMSPTIQRVVRRLSAIADQAFITIDLQLDQDVPILILEDDLYQIVYNLIENGIKYNVPDGTLTVTLLHEDDNALLQVTDTGMGIPEDAIDHIFERFYRVDKARSRQSGGSGLGLAIVKTIVERNKGEISVASTLGKGTTFTVTFPAFDTEVDKT